MPQDTRGQVATEPDCKLPLLFPVYYRMADTWQSLIEELVLERPHVWEAEA